MSLVFNPTGLRIYHVRSRCYITIAFSALSGDILVKFGLYPCVGIFYASNLQCINLCAAEALVTMSFSLISSIAA